VSPVGVLAGGLLHRSGMPERRGEKARGGLDGAVAPRRCRAGRRPSAAAPAPTARTTCAWRPSGWPRSACGERCQAAPGNVPPIADTRPAWASEVNRRTPVRPRAVAQVRLRPGHIVASPPTRSVGCAPVDRQNPTKEDIPDRGSASLVSPSTVTECLAAIRTISHARLPLHSTSLAIGGACC
jgi:hypothetical protein